jgi:hypothetical protein
LPSLSKPLLFVKTAAIAGQPFWSRVQLKNRLDHYFIIFRMMCCGDKNLPVQLVTAVNVNWVINLLPGIQVWLFSIDTRARYGSVNEGEIEWI